MAVDPTLFRELLDEGETTGPVYRRIAAVIGTGVTTGRIVAGDRLPTHRELARGLGVAVPTVSRAYRQAEQEGLISSTVERGSFVSSLPRLRDTPTSGLSRSAGRLDMAVNAPARGMHNELLRGAFRAHVAVSTTAETDVFLGYEPDIGRYEHRESACRWLARSGLDVDPRQVAICHGGQGALHVALAASLRADEMLLTEALTHPGVRSRAQLLDIRMSAVVMDAEGLIPEALEEACTSGAAPRPLYCMPTAHNPTAVTFFRRRRQAIVDIARRNDLLIIEDDVFGLLCSDTDAGTPLATPAPERTLFLTSLSKTLAPGLRCGFLAGPPEMAGRLGALIRATVFNPSPLSTAVAIRWLDDGTADRLLEWQRAEMARRRAAVEHLLRVQPEVSNVRTAALHAWVELHESWSASEVVALADDLGISISPTVYFCADDQVIPRGVRLCLGNAADVTTLTNAIRILTQRTETRVGLDVRHPRLTAPHRNRPDCSLRRSHGRGPRKPEIAPMPREHVIDGSRVHHAWDASLKPALHIEPGDIVHFDLKMAGHGQIRRGVPYERTTVDFTTLYHLLGPIHVEGARPGDALEVDILELNPGAWGWCAVLPQLGLLPSDFPDPFIRYFDLSGGEYTELVPGVRIPINPFLGVMGTLPDDIETAPAFPPHKGGGNIDSRHLTQGATLQLPVFRDGAVFSCGDPHAAQGDGEVCVSAIETDMTATLRFNIRHQTLSTPRFTVPAPSRPQTGTGAYYGTMGIHADLMQGAKTAVRGMIDLIVEQIGLTPEDAYVLCSVAGDLRIFEIVDAGVWNVGFTLPQSLFNKPV